MSSHPEILDGAQVLAFAIVDESITYEDRKTLYVDGALLGEVPQLAIGKYEDDIEILVFHCDIDWNVLGVSAHLSILSAVQHVERSYNGLLKKWIEVKN